MNGSLPQCPVPPDQLPKNEYESLQHSCFFGWTTRSSWDYCRRAILLWAGGSVLSLPIAVGCLPAEASWLQVFLISGAGGLLGFVLILTRIYLGWRYVRDRLEAEQVIYEETGWYDGQRWPKPAPELNRDRLISTYEVRPVIQRVQWSFIGIGVGAIAGVGVWQLIA